MGAFRAVMASVPFPLDVALAPVAAAGAFAGVMALASAAGGMDVTHDTLAQLHAHEVVLPAPLSTGFKKIIGQMNPGGGVGAASDSAHPTEQHVHSHNFTTHI